MISLPIGIVCTILVMLYAMGGGSIQDYIQPHSIVLVIGGTITILLYTTPTDVLKAVINSVRHLFQNEVSFVRYQDVLVRLAKNRLDQGQCDHPLIQYARTLWEQGVDSDLFVVLLSQKKNELESTHLDSVQSLKNLSKYPPALGMAGTVMGMIALFSQLDADGSNVGRNIALAMTATFFGIILTNAIISPLADRLQVRHVHYKRVNRNLYEVILLINRNESASLITDETSNRAA